MNTAPQGFILGNEKCVENSRLIQTDNFGYRRTSASKSLMKTENSKMKRDK